MKKIEYVILQSSDGEIHFQECKAVACKNDKKFNAEEALKLAREEANKPFYINHKRASKQADC